jgi:hypothetical protein
MCRVLVLITLLFVSGSVSAQGVVGPYGTTVTTDAVTRVSLYCVPDGSGRSLQDADPLMGSLIDATIRVGLISEAGNPVAGVPAEDMWLEPTSGNFVQCFGAGGYADAPTDINGTTTFSGSIPGGGSSAMGDGAMLRLVIRGTPVLNQDMDIVLNSPDINGDLKVDLSDTVLFVSRYQSGEYDYAVDYSYDGVVNLSDLVLYSQALNSACGD